MDGWSVAIEVATGAIGGRTQQEIADVAGVSQTTISNFLAHKKLPEPTTIFGIETALELPAGTLSRHLGYLPPDAVPVVTPEDAVKADPTLDADQRRAVLTLLAAFRRAAPA